jgi:flagellar M-ring protein FliF
VLFVVRPLVRRIVAADTPALDRTSPSLLVAGSGAAGVSGVPAVAETPVIASQTSKMIDIAQVQGQVHAMSIQKVGELANKNPNEAVSIIRQWLNDSPA